MSKKGKYDIAVLFDCIANNEDSSFLIPKMVIEGQLDEDLFITKDEQGYLPITDAAFEDHTQCYGFPLTADSLIDGKKLIDFTDTEIKRLMSDYIDDVLKYSYFLHIEDSCDEVIVYKTDMTNLETHSIDDSRDFYFAIANQKPVAKSIKAIKNIPNENPNKSLVLVTPQPTKETTYETLAPKTKPKAKNITQIYQKVIRNVLFQDEQVQQILTAIMKNQLIEDPKLKTNILLAGPTGVGKTEIVRSLKKELALPLVVEDATQYTIAGYVGKSIEEMLINLYEIADGDLALAERGILVIDEIDKKANPDGKSDSVAGKGVLNSLLKMMEGNECQIVPRSNHVTFDTSRLTIIVAGAFSEIDQIRERKLGFNQHHELSNQTSVVDNAAFVKYGMPPEFLGRCHLKIFLNKLGVEEFKQILKKSQSSNLVLNRKFFNSQGVKLDYATAIEEIAKKAASLGTGARSLNSIVETALSKATFEVLGHPNMYERLIITPETINDPNKYILTKKR